MQAFARSIVEAANTTGNLRILPITQKDKAKGCIIRFSMGFGTLATNK